ncbi:odorant receptor 42a-like [Zeugodacus cucurbitae]|uniref:odorant receptor 42a-like n=1 Tax=Zeugodacus cucurbitae TaxID=28588 RepID=UPI0023D93A14|nr:odorant receptor 42a-like [Zeugodacus cucurbitae]
MRKFFDLFYGRGAGDFATNDSFQIVFFYWALIGIKPLRPLGLFRSLHMLFCWICLLMSPIAFNVGFMQVVQNSSMTVILTTLQATLNVLALPLKAIVTGVYLERLRSVEPIFKCLDARYHSAEERFTIKDSVIKSSRLFVIVGGIYFAYGTISWLPALFTHSQPLNTWLPFIDWIPEPTINFWLHFLFEVLYVYFLLVSQFTNDIYSAIYLKALRTHITLLAERVSRLGENPKHNDDDNYRDLIDCVRSHQELLE